MKKIKIIAINKRANFDYQILEKFTAGIKLNGQEVKSIKKRGVNLKGTYVVVKNNEVFWQGANIPPWQPQNKTSGYNLKRDRKLLLKKSEIKYLIGKSKQKGLTLIPIKLYTINGLIKLEFAISKGKKKVNKKEDIKKKEIEREIERKIKEYNL